MPSKLSSSFFLSILIFITAPCLAGQLVQYQSQPTAAPSTPKKTTRGYTAHLNLGYSWTNWSDSYPYDFTSNGDGSFTVGLGITKPFNQYFSAQSSYFYTPSVDYNNNGGHSISQWLTTLMGLMKYPLSDSTQCYLGGGFGMRYTDFNSNTSVTIRPAFSAGVQYTLNSYWDIQGQYLRVNNVGDDSHGNYIPVSNIISFGIGYSF